MQRNRQHRRAERPDYVWTPWMDSKSVTLPNDTSTFKREVLGAYDFGGQDILDHDATVERVRGRIVIVKATSGVGQFVVAGRNVHKDVADATGSSSPDLFDLDSVGDDFPLWIPFACVDSDATSMWNGHEVDVKARRRISKGTVFQLIINGLSVDTSGVNENYFVGWNLRFLIRQN